MIPERERNYGGGALSVQAEDIGERYGQAPATAPCVSAICHTYNHRDYIGQALDGILAQSANFPIEVIVHDDASTDGTADIVRQYCDAHTGVVHAVLQRANQHSRGRLAKRFTYPLVRGEFIALCEGDDCWCDVGKLHKQVEALSRHPEVDLCVHPAWRESMRTGRRRRAFVHGSKERIVPPTPVVARHNQFAPTASVLMRADAARALPDWWFHGDPPPPKGDCFIESIIGLKGVLYLPETMSVYRRGVQGSYTHGFQQAAGSALEAELQLMLDYTARLREIDGMPAEALERRAQLVRLNYALQFLAANDRCRFIRVARAICDPGMPGVVPALRLMATSRPAFAAGRLAFRAWRRLRS